MNSDFIRIKELDGELKISHKTKDYGLTVSTREFVLHKPHVNYHVKLDDISSIVPFPMSGFKPITFVNQRASNHEVTSAGMGTPHYRLYAGAAVMHNRSGIFTLGPIQFVLPVHREVLTAIAEHGRLGRIATDTADLT